MQSYNLRPGSARSIVVLALLALPCVTAGGQTSGAATASHPSPTALNSEPAATVDFANDPPAPDPQSAPPATQAPATTAGKPHSLEREFFKNILKDQRAIWTSPMHLRPVDAVWLAPLGAATATLIATDSRSAEESGEFSDNSTHARVSSDFSRLGAGYVGASVAGTFYLVGLAAHNPRARETGLLAGEAMIDSAIVVGVLKGITRRPRPDSSNNDGDFFQGGNSFPSGHTITAWTLATVVAEEYGSHKWVAPTAYSLAALVGAARYAGHSHYLSDVLVGGAIGFGIGRYVVRAHHDPSLDTEVGDHWIDKKIMASRFVPAVLPRYSPVQRDYGLLLRWGL